MKNWLVDVKQKHPLLREFKEWFTEQISEGHVNFSLEYYGFGQASWDCYDYVPSYFKVITLEEWKEMYFPKWIPKQGELVEVRDDDEGDWYEAIFISMYKGKYIAEGEWYIDSWGQCKKKPSKIDSKIDELKKLAEKQGLKITITIE